MPQKITIISEDFPPNYGGISEWARGVAENLHAFGYKINVICKHVTYVENNTNWPFEVEYLKHKYWKKMRTWYWIAALKEQIKSGNVPDLIIGTKWSTSRGLIKLCKQNNISLVTVVHGTEVTGNLNWYKRLWLKNTLVNSDHVISVSQFTADYLLDNFSLSGTPIKVLPNGVDLNNFGSASGVERLRDELGLEGKQVIMTISRVIERKGHDLVIRALPKLIKDNKNIVYVIAGPCDEAEKNRLMQLAKELDVLSYVKMTGYIDANDLSSMYQLCDVYCMPSRLKEENGDSEGFGITFLEANASKKPAIGGRSGGCVDAIVDGETGYLVDPLDPAELTEKINYLLHNPDVAKAMGKGYKRIEDEFNWNSITEQLVKEINLN